jgi:cysteine desulfurase
LGKARVAIAEALGWRHDVIFTSGATEAIRIAAHRIRVPGRVLGATEHDAVQAAMRADAAIVPVNNCGLIYEAALEEALAAGPALVAIQQVNNETGVIQPLDCIAERVRAAGSLLLADCAQSAGKLPLPDGDFIAISAHKFGGPPGVGALLVRDLDRLEATGGQERGYRRGTENLPAVAGMAAALQAEAFTKAMPGLTELRSALDKEIVANGGLIIGAGAQRSPSIGAYAMPGVPSASQLIQFDLAGISVSAGSACSSGSMKSSKVHAAMGLAPEFAGCSIRVSFGPQTSAADIDRFVGQWCAMRARAAHAA